LANVDWWEGYIRSQAAKYGLDPDALIAVAQSEGLGTAGDHGTGGGVGDNGTSFGPFQLHVGGALPQGRGRAWAESRAGIDYALGQIGSVAKGLHGSDAISNIVSQFERPAKPLAEIQRALSYYKATPGVIPQQGFIDGRKKGVANVGASSDAAFSATGGAPEDPGVGGSFDPRRLLASAMTASANFAKSGHIDQSGTIQALLAPPAQRQAPSQQTAQAVLAGIGGGGSAQAYNTAKGGLAEAFYDPLGQWDNGRFSSKGIGGHSDHVHVSITNAQTMLRAIRRAQEMGLAARENPYVDAVDPVHVKGSYHYRDFPGQYGGKKLGEALDVSGNAKLMSDYFRWALANLR